jgi:hypothetical protein
MNAIHANKQDKMKDKMEQVYSKFTIRAGTPTMRNLQYSTVERLSMARYQQAMDIESKRQKQHRQNMSKD